MNRKIHIEQLHLTLPRTAAAAQTRQAAERFAHEIAHALANDLAKGDHLATNLPAIGTIHARVPASGSSAAQISQAVQKSVGRRVATVSQKGGR